MHRALIPLTLKIKQNLLVMVFHCHAVFISYRYINKKNILLCPNYIMWYWTASSLTVTGYCSRVVLAVSSFVSNLENVSLHIESEQEPQAKEERRDLLFRDEPLQAGHRRRRRVWQDQPPHRLQDRRVSHPAHPNNFRNGRGKVNKLQHNLSNGKDCLAYKARNIAMNDLWDC